MSQQNLESLLKGAGNTVDMLRNSAIGAYVYPVVPSEFYNWRDAQQAARDRPVLFDLEKDEGLFGGGVRWVSWIQFHGESGGFKVDMIRDDRSPSHPRGKAVTRRHYRYQVQGPNAAKVLEKLNGGPLPDVKFFTMDAINIRGRKVRALRHGMAGAPGHGVWGSCVQVGEERAALPGAPAAPGPGSGGWRAPTP